MDVSLTLEGGAARSIFSMSVVWALKKRYGLEKVDVGSGSSAGLIPVSYMAAGGFDAGKCCELFSDSRLMGIGNVFRAGSYINLGHITDEVMKNEYPLDADALLSSGMEVIVPVTDVKTGKVRYFTNRDGFEGCDIPALYKAAMLLPIPLVSRKFSIGLDGGMYFDGGYSDPLPLDHPHVKDTAKIICLTKSCGFKKERRLEDTTTELLKPFVPDGTYKAMKSKSDVYWSRAGEALRLEKEDGAVVLRPEDALSRFDSSPENVRHCLRQAYRAVYDNPRLDELMQEMKRSEKAPFYFGEAV